MTVKDGEGVTDAFGNVARYNPKRRECRAQRTSMTKILKIREDGIRFELRGEAFDLLNRITFGPLSGRTRLQNANFGLWRSQSNSPRRITARGKTFLSGGNCEDSPAFARPL